MSIHERNIGEGGFEAAASGVTPFLFEGEHMLRAVWISDDPWFVAADACAVLGVKNPTQAVQALDDDERAMLNIGRQGEANVVSEGGLYTLILRSHLATTPGTIQHRFRKWVTGDVIPSIRKTGAYAMQGEVAQDAERRPFPDWSMEEMRTKRGIVDMYRLLYGIMPAQWIGPQLGFPVPPVELVENGRQMRMVLVPQVENDD
ncbi:BRO-N domain-containing protein [Pseudogemmobacter bohemicus]|uniref:BRO-N domain-containing protein n=1 Tax=Pseudogemmobacter bohemicus TaxID=2250708 RepID=UPI0018E544CB|nr:BRO family protein [Pseudogemmobacter bohemicus]